MTSVAKLELPIKPIKSDYDMYRVDVIDTRTFEIVISQTFSRATLSIDSERFDNNAEKIQNSYVENTCLFLADFLDNDEKEELVYSITSSNFFKTEYHNSYSIVNNELLKSHTEAYERNFEIFKQDLVKALSEKLKITSDSDFSKVNDILKDSGLKLNTDKSLNSIISDFDKIAKYAFH